MRGFLILVLVVVIVGVGVRMAGVRLPLIDYPIGPAGEGQGPGMPHVVIEAPGFDDADRLP
jgi:hypothetical protein